MHKKIVPVREFLKFTPKQMLDGYKTNNDILFEDDVIVNVHYKDMVLNRYIMDVCLLIPELKYTSCYNISNFYTNGTYTNKTLGKCFEVIFKDIVKTVCNVNNNFKILEDFNLLVVEIYDVVYNELGCELVEYSSSANILDYLEIQMDENLLNSIRYVYEKNDVESINMSYDVLDTILTKSDKYKHNPIAKAYVSGMVNPNQIKQILAPRGYVTEIDGSIFKYPIASSFTLGMNSIYDLAIESRSGAKALFLSNKAVQDSEYLARELQLVTMVVDKLVHTDCGNKDYINWYIRPDQNGKSDLPNLIGKRYLDPVTNTEKIISKNDKHLEGTTIKIRSVLKCKLKNDTHVCSACMGELSNAVYEHTNLGHVCTATVTQKITQSILSTKHLTSSATTNNVKLEGDANKFFMVKEKNGIAFRSSVISKSKNKVELILTQEEAFGIKDIEKIEDIPKLEIARVSKIESMVLVVTNKVGKEYYSIPVKDGSKYGSFTHKFLEYILEKGFTLDERDRYVIDVSDWKYVSPIIMLPQIEFSFLELAKTVKKMLKNIGVKKTPDGIISNDTPESILQKLFDLINSKLDINIALLEVIIYAFTIKSLKDNNYELGRNIENQEVTDIVHIMPNRSMGGAYAWETIAQKIIKSTSFRREHRTNHPLDVMLTPNEVLDDYGYKTK